ncbi:hypothetical protein M1O14_01870 [Dehalococcoidia bacterium]|nr:hypothetical protein [Dehalococcoidia bacterium]
MRKYIWRIGGALVVLAVIVAAVPVFIPPGYEAGGGEPPGAGVGGIPGLITLARPAFAARTAGANFLEEEAGISAFTNVGREIDLVRARGAFRTIERETDEYIIGSVGVPGLGEADDVHVFVHRDGWVVAYYGRERPAAWIVDWRDLETTKLEAALMQVTTAAGVSIGDVNYYDFRHPEAEKLMIIIDGHSFNLKIPGTFTVFERSYTVEITACACARFGIDREERASFYIDQGRVLFVRDIARGTVSIRIDTLTPAQLRLGEFHTFTFRQAQGDIDGAIVLVYREG